MRRLSVSLLMALLSVAVLSCQTIPSDKEKKRNVNDKKMETTRAKGADGKDQMHKSEALLKLEEGLKDSDLRRRREAAEDIAAMSGVDVEIKVNILIGVLKDEILNPQSTDLKSRSGIFKSTDFLKNGYFFALTKVGESAIPFIKGRYTRETGELKERLIIVLGTLGDRSMYDDLVYMAKTNKNPYTKAQAIRALSDTKMGGMELIPLYKELLKDEYHIRVTSDTISPPDLDYYNIRYPVREEAFSALRELGIDVKRDKNEFYVVEQAP